MQEETSWISDETAVKEYLKSREINNNIIKFSPLDPCRVDVNRLLYLSRYSSMNYQIKIRTIRFTGFWMYFIIDMDCGCYYTLIYRQTEVDYDREQKNFKLDDKYPINLSIINTH